MRICLKLGVKTDLRYLLEGDKATHHNLEVMMFKGIGGHRRKASQKQLFGRLADVSCMTS